MKYLRITITDVMGFWDDYQDGYDYNPDQARSFTSWCRLPNAWVANGELKPKQREAIYRYWYGENWRLGNGDGSQFIVLQTDQHELSPEEVKQRAWEQAGETCLVVRKDGGIEKVEAGKL
jgi:hypothetical protein